MSDMHVTMDSSSQVRPLKDSVRNFERQIIFDALKAYGDDKRVVAKLLGISLSSLYRKISDFSGDHDRKSYGMSTTATN